MSHYTEQYEEDEKNLAKERRILLLEKINNGLQNLENNELYKVKILIENIKKLEGSFNFLKDLFY